MAPDVLGFADAVAWLTRNTQSGVAYVHCAHGQGRSVLAAAGYLLATGHAPDAKTAMAQIKALRPKAKLSPDQWKILQEFARRVK
jgi:protein-tyrosine phosphatase